MSINPENNNDDGIHPNLKFLSYSAQMMLEECPRKYELDRLSERPVFKKDTHIDFGHIIGHIIQEYMITKDLNKTIFSAFLSWPNNILEYEEEDIKSNKNFWFSLYALDKFIPFKKEELFGYEMAVFNNKPSAELGFNIHCPNGFQYRGKLDGLLINAKGKFACMEIKTTKTKNIHPAMYQNSGQGLGYSAIVDTIASEHGLQQPKSFPVFYIVYNTTNYEWKCFEFIKSRTMSARWIQHILRTIQHIAEYAEASFFPMHGQNCFSYFRPCRWFDICEMRNEFVIGKLENIKLKEDAKEEYPFNFSLEAMIMAQLEKGNEI